VTHGLRGWFAIMVDKDGPVQSGIGSYATAKEAERETADWARSEGLPSGALLSRKRNHDQT
jgi:hypothetical protein